jgi:hypothetical protein
MWCIFVPMMRGMSWWGEKSPQILEPEPPVDREAAALAIVRELKSDLDALNSEMLRFKTENHVKTDRFGRLLAIQCATLTGRPVIEKAWRELLHRRDKIVAQWHAALREWSEVKGAAK